MPSTPSTCTLPQTLLHGLILALATASGAQAQAPKGPSIPEMKPGKYAYAVEMNNPGMPMKMPPMNFTQCVTAKDMDEGRAFQAQKEAGMNCTYSNMKSAPGSFSFTAACTMKGGMSVLADYDGKVAGNTVTMAIRQKMTGGDMPDAMRSSTMRMVMTRQGDC